MQTPEDLLAIGRWYRDFQCKIIGRGVESDSAFNCCAHCAHAAR